MEPIGIIAGNGQFPFIIAEEARKKGQEVVAIALKEEAHLSLKDHVDRIYWVSLGQIGKILSICKKEHIEKAIMAGQVKHNKLFANFVLDVRALKILMTVKNRQTDTILSAVADEFEKNGITFIPSTTYLEDLIPAAGVLTESHPTRAERDDVQFGFDIAKKVSALDIGQTIVVKDKAIIAIEAMEGTDACIQRAGVVAAPFGGKSNMIVVKVAKVRQDIRFDVPVIGLKTVEVLKDSGARVLAFEAGKTLLFDKDYFIKLANKYTISVIGIEEKPEKK